MLSLKNSALSTSCYGNVNKRCRGCRHVAGGVAAEATLTVMESVINKNFPLYDVI